VAPAALTASSELAALPVKGRAPMTGYSRSQFGPAWTDDTTAPWSHNGLDTRNDILSRDLTDVSCKSQTLKAAPHCTVATGTLHEPYTGQTIHFVRGFQTSAKVQIDHVVALGDAWQTGAQQLTFGQREALANDPLNLIAADGPANEAKGDSDAASWLPPNKSFRCDYVARQVAVKRKYGLWMTAAEKAAVGNVLAKCPGEPAITDARALIRTY
jgi:hypothetical protein